MEDLPLTEIYTCSTFFFKLIPKIPMTPFGNLLAKSYIKCQNFVKLINRLTSPFPSLSQHYSNLKNYWANEMNQILHISWSFINL